MSSYASLSSAKSGRHTIDSTVGSTGLAVLADSFVPLVAIVAVGGTLGVVGPTPVGVDGDFAVDVRTRALARALLPRHLRMRLSRLLAHLLGRGPGHEGREGCDSTEHFDGGVLCFLLNE